MIDTRSPRSNSPETPQPRPPAPDDLVTCLAKAVASSGLPPLLLTLSTTAVRNQFSHVFGPDRTLNLLARPAGGRTGGLEFAPAEGSGAAPRDLRSGIHALVVRFVETSTFAGVASSAGRWLREATAIMLQFPPTARQVASLSEAGFSLTRRFTPGGREIMLFMRPQVPAPSRRDSTRLAGRTALRRLVIVDPCLGAAAGHYLGYANRITKGAAALGVDVVWACHAHLDPEIAPQAVVVRRCFPRCFFDLDGSDVGVVDLSVELAHGWRSLLDEFDDDGTHFLLHSADAHQLRAIGEVLDASGDIRSAIHVNFQTSPRFMPGRLAGIEAHAAVMQLRIAAQWERSLFFWAETRRLGRWLSEWLGEDIPAAPFLAPSTRAQLAPGGGGSSAPTLSYLGEGRPSKGFLDLPGLLDAVANDQELRGALKVVVQDWRPFRGDPVLHEQAVARIREHPFVEIVEGVLSPEDYERQLAGADILLLPYDPATYNLQGSGILIEGFSRGSIIVARDDMAAGDEAAHGVLFTYRNPDDLRRLLRDILADFESLTRLARDKARDFRADATADRYILALDSRARGGARE